MSKTKDGKQEETLNNSSPAAENQAPKAKDEQIILTAKNRDELFTQFNELKASYANSTLSTGAVGRHDDGSYSLIVNIHPKIK